MSYLNYLKGILSWAEITKELNYQYDGDQPIIIIRELQGSIFEGSVVQPVQLEIQTSEMEETKTLLNAFVLAYNNTSYTDDLDYIKQFYTTPMVIANFETIGSNYSSRLLISATLIISKNVSSIKRVLIDGEEYITSQRNLIYATVPDNQATNMDGKINTTQVRNANLKFTCSMISRADTLGNKIRLIRGGNVGINNSFTVKLIHSDNDYAETHTMKMISHTVNDNNANLPVLTVEFIK